MANHYHNKPRWPMSVIPGRTREAQAASEASHIIAPNAEAMRVELALERDRSSVEALLDRAGQIAQDAVIARKMRTLP